MKTLTLDRMRTALRMSPILLSLVAVATAPIGAGAQAAAARGATFAAPDDAMQAVIKAAKEKNHAALATIFGPKVDNLLTGNQVEDFKDLDDFSTAAQQSSALQKESDTRYTIVVGASKYPFPIPIVKAGTQWTFDTQAGTEEVFSRRIGEDELAAIATCRAYVLAQWEYFTENDWDRDGVNEYAQRIRSSPGMHNGLYWPTADGDKPSPMGAQVAAAIADNASNAKDGDDSAPTRMPYHGYHLRILTAQGPAAPGGKYGYVINGNMIAGHALVAYPSEWGRTGVMTFIVNQQGRVYERNLGPNTVAIARAMTTYDPGPGWRLAPQ